MTVTEVPSSSSQSGDGGQNQPAGQSGGQTKKSSSNVPATTTPTTPATTTSTTNAILNVGGLILEARDPGTWGNNLTAWTSGPNVRDDQDAQNRYGLKKADLFNLSVVDAKTNVTETFPNVTLQTNSPGEWIRFWLLTQI